MNLALNFSLSVPGCLTANTNHPSSMSAFYGPSYLLISFSISSLHPFDLVRGTEGLKMSTGTVICSFCETNVCISSIPYFKSISLVFGDIINSDEILHGFTFLLYVTDIVFC